MKKSIYTLSLIILSLLSFGATMQAQNAQDSDIKTIVRTSDSQVPLKVAKTYCYTDGLVYENAFIGLGCTLPSDWTFYSDEEIMQLNNYTADVMGEEYKELMESAQIVYDMYADDSTGMNNINVSLEKIDNRMLAGVDVADIYAQNAAMFVEMYTSMGCSNVVAEPTTFDIGGEEFDGIAISAEINGSTLYQKCFGVKCNGYLASIAITAYADDVTDDIISSFYLVD